MPEERREGEREDERTEWRGRRSGEERMRMRLGLVSGGVDILRTTEDFLVGMVSTGRRLCPVQIEHLFIPVGVSVWY